LFSKKSKTQGFTELFSIFLAKKSEFGEKKVFDDFEAFLRLFVFEKSRKFVNDCREIKIMKKGFNIVKSHIFPQNFFLSKKIENRSANP